MSACPSCPRSLSTCVSSNGFAMFCTLSAKSLPYISKPTQMDKGEISMIENLPKNTGKSLEQWLQILSPQKFEKHGQAMKFLKEHHQLSHGFANLISLKYMASKQPASTDDDLLEKQYVGKEHLRPIYDRLIVEILKFGNDIELAPKKAYVSLRRKKQFALLQPVTKTRFEIGIILKNQPADGRLEAITTPNAMCTHKISITSEKEVDKQVVKWLKAAYDAAG